MYAAYGWPRILATSDALLHQEDVIYIHVDHDYLVLVTTSRIQIWTGGQHRVRLGCFSRSLESLRSDGLNKKAHWVSSKRSLAILVGATSWSCPLC